MNIILIGYRAAGKSTVGKTLAERLDKKFVDTDEVLKERHGVSITDMVKAHGWSYFRAHEKRLIEDVSREDHLVIAPGGGVVLDEENVMALKKNGFLIWLKAELEVLTRRMDQDPQTVTNRPPLTGKGALEELRDVMAYRIPYYEKAMDTKIDTSTMGVQAVVEAVLSIVQTPLHLSHREGNRAGEMMADRLERNDLPSIDRRSE